MKKLFLLITALMAAGLLSAAPAVTNVMAAQTGNVVLISYRLAHPDNLPCEVSLRVSNDGGASYTIIPTSLSGDYGTIAATADGAQYQINWFFGLDGVGNGNNYRVKVLADDGAGEVAQPVFDPPGGSYDSAQTVSISCATNGATIRYTTDGSEPDSASLLYSNPIIVGSTLTLKAKGFKPGWIPSAIASATYTITSLPSQMIFVPGGTFNPTTYYTVTLSSFYIGKYEVTQSEYQAVMGTNPSYFGGNPNRPVEQVSWFNAIEYCNRRSMQEGFTPCYSYSSYGTNPDNWPTGWNTLSTNHTNVSCNWSANGYRLPTEMEWMFAAKGGNQSQGYTYSGSNDIDAVAWYYNNSGVRTHDVGEKAANELGTFDMSGNVWEWCWDIWGNYPTGNYTDPTGPASGSSRVVRGGSWPDDANGCTVSFRNFADYATDTLNCVGFRCLRVSP
jgi:formylglycine-generating enzyme required for sulfatase activity